MSYGQYQKNKQELKRKKDDKDARKFTYSNTAGDQWNTPLKEVVSTAFINFKTYKKWINIQDNMSLAQSCRNRNWNIQKKLSWCTGLSHSLVRLRPGMLRLGRYSIMRPTHDRAVVKDTNTQKRQRTLTSTHIVTPTQSVNNLIKNIRITRSKDNK